MILNCFTTEEKQHRQRQCAQLFDGSNLVSIMESGCCLFNESVHCDCDSNDDRLRPISAKRLETVKIKSKKRTDILHKTLATLPPTAELMTHEACIKRYNSDDHIDRYLKRVRKEKAENEPVYKIARRSSCEGSFKWEELCFFCGTECDIEVDKKHPDRWRKAYLCGRGQKSGHTVCMS